MISFTKFHHVENLIHISFNFVSDNVKIIKLHFENYFYHSIRNRNDSFIKVCIPTGILNKNERNCSISDFHQRV